MNRVDYEMRRRRGLPIESFRELVFAIADVQKLTKERSPTWYFLNRVSRDAMAEAEKVERG